VEVKQEVGDESRKNEDLVYLYGKCCYRRPKTYSCSAPRLFSTKGLICPSVIVFT